MFGSSSSAFFNTWRHRGYPSKPYWGLSKHAAICPPNFFFVIWVTGWIGGKIWLPFSCKLLLKNGYFPDELTRGLYLMKKQLFTSEMCILKLTLQPDLRVYDFQSCVHFITLLLLAILSSNSQDKILLSILMVEGSICWPANDKINANMK